MKVKKTTAFKCTECDTLHVDEDDAKDCCPQFEKIEAFECGECGEIYEDNEEAKDCCK